MDLVRITQNFYVVISLFFGDKSHSATFFSDWAKHMYNSSIISIVYTSLQASDHFSLPMYYLLLIAHYKFTGDLVVMHQADYPSMNK